MGSQSKGFTLTEMAVSCGILSILAVIAIPGYNVYIARQQAAESVVLMDTLKNKSLQNIIKLGKCTEVGTTETLSGKYGSVVVSGTASKTALIDNQVLQKSGCIYTYTLKAEAHRFISGKTIIADLFNNGALSKSTLSTVDDLYIPKALVTLVEGVKSTINGDTPVTTPTDPVPQLDPETDPTNPTDPTDPTTPPTPDPGDKDDNEPDGGNETVNPPTGKPDIIIDPDNKPDGGVCENKYSVDGDETVISIGNNGYYRQESSYYIRDSISLYNTFTKSAGRLPRSGEKIKFVTTCSVAFVSTSQSIPSLFVGNWPSSVQISLVNFGAILGRGGDAQDVISNGWSYSPKPGTGSAPGDAMYNYSAASLNVLNHGVIAGGGSAGAESVSRNKGGSTRAGGGAPFGIGGKTWLTTGERFYPNKYGVKDGGDASFTGGGGAGVYHDIYSGRGGAWGEVGTRANNNTFVHPAGRVYTGNVIIINTGSGYTKGN